MRKAGKITFFIGATGTVLLVVVAAVMVIFYVRGFNTSLSSLQPVNGTATIDHDGETNLAIYALDMTTAQQVADDCTIEGPDGEAMYKSGSSGTMSNNDSEQWYYEGIFATKKAGTYTVTCTGELSDARLMVGKPLGAGLILGFVGSMLAGIFGGIAFFLVTVLGLVLWIVGRNKEKKQVPPAGYGAQNYQY